LIGVFFNARRDQGGLYQYALSMVHALACHRGKHEYVIFNATASPLPLRIGKARARVVDLPGSEVRLRQTLEYVLMIAARAGLRRRLAVLPEYSSIRAVGPDLMVYVKPSVLSFLWGYPSVFPVHDLQHLFQPQFPEVSAYGEVSRREYILRNAIPKAAAVLADSPMGREDIIKIYGAKAEHVHSLPHLAPSYLSRNVNPADVLRVRLKYSLPEQYFFYPAVFWRHKNHACLLRAMSLLRAREPTAPDLVFAGSRTRQYRNLVAQAHVLGLEDHVRFIGYVPDDDIPPLYRNAVALVMPTFFGYTNTPCIEAWAYECPVITSTARGIPEHVGDAALVVHPEDPSELADSMERAWKDLSLRETLIEKGKGKVAQWTPRDFGARLEDILDSCLGHLDR